MYLEDLPSFEHLPPDDGELGVLDEVKVERVREVAEANLQGRVVELVGLPFRLPELPELNLELVLPSRVEGRKAGSHFHHRTVSPGKTCTHASERVSAMPDEKSCSQGCGRGQLEQREATLRIVLPSG